MLKYESRFVTLVAVTSSDRAMRVKQSGEAVVRKEEGKLDLFEKRSGGPMVLLELIPFWRHLRPLVRSHSPHRLHPRDAGRGLDLTAPPRRHPLPPGHQHRHHLHQSHRYYHHYRHRHWG